MLLNTGDTPVASPKGLLTTIAWRLGDAHDLRARRVGVRRRRGRAVAARRAARHQHVGRRRAADARRCPTAGGVYLVPAFVGLGAPYWDPHARGTIVGLTRDSRIEHIARAAVDAMAYQTRDVLEVMQEEAGPDAAAPQGGRRRRRPTRCCCSSRPTSSACRCAARSWPRRPRSAPRTWPASPWATGTGSTTCAATGRSTASSRRRWAPRRGLAATGAGGAPWSGRSAGRRGLRARATRRRGVAGGQRAQHDRRRRRDVQRVHLAVHRDPHLQVGAGQRRRRQAVAFGADEHGRARRQHHVVERRGVGRQACRRSRPGRAARRRSSASGQSAVVDPRQAERRRHRRADGLAVERIAAARSEHDGLRRRATAALRKRPPTLSGLFTPSATTTQVERRPRQGVEAARQRDAPASARQPRWMLKPTTPFITACGTTNTGVVEVQRGERRRHGRRPRSR